MVQVWCMWHDIVVLRICRPPALNEQYVHMHVNEHDKMEEHKWLCQVDLISTCFC